ncbi:MAG: MlaD family protein [Kiritimatiellae bacterium]|nr:MlaD family protein [Kiritimatiellia bacterium]
MPPVPFKFRYVHEIVGVFVLVALALLLAGLVLMGRAQRWFEREVELRTVFPAEGTFGVQRGTRVEILGATAGRVEEVRVRDDATIEGRLRLRSDFARFLRSDSQAVVKKEFGVAGAAYIVIELGAGAPLVAPDGATIPIRKDTELLEIVQLVVEQIQEAVLPVLKEVQATLAEYRGLAADLRSPEHALQKILVDLQRITDGLQAGQGTIGRLLTDPAMALEAERAMAETRALLAEVRAAVAEVQRILEHLRGASEHLPQLMGTVEGELRNVPGLVLQVRATLQETERLLAGLQRHWLLRAAMTPDLSIAPLPAAAAGTPAAEAR